MSLATPGAASRLELPPGVLTGIGSLPFAEPADAVRFVARHCPRLPFCPQPPPGPDLAAAMVSQARELRGSGGRQRRWFNGFEWAVRRRRFPAAVAFKTQVTGPLTLAQLSGLGAQHRTLDVEFAHLVPAVAGWAAWQAERLLSHGLPTLVYVDEPVLGALDDGVVPQAVEVLAPVFAAIRAAGAVPGLHCCTGAPLGALSNFGADIVSVDATRLSPDLAEAGATWHEHKCRLSLGLATSSGGAGDPFAHWLSVASLAGNPVDVAKRTIVTPTCGLGGVDADTAAATFRHAANAAAGIARVAAEGS